MSRGRLGEVTPLNVGKKGTSQKDNAHLQCSATFISAYYRVLNAY